MLEQRSECRVRPNGPLVGTAQIPASKSIAQRALVWAAAAQGQQVIEGCGSSADVEATLHALLRLGVRMESTDDGHVRVTGDSSLNWSGRGIPVGESGTLARLLLGLLGTHSGATVQLQPSGSLRKRAPSSLVRALERLGAGIEGPGYELSVYGVATSPPWQLDDPTSSQDVSALLGALAARGGGRLVVNGTIPSEPYINLSVRVLERFGVNVERSRGVFDVRGRLQASSTRFTIEPDASAAGVALCAAAASAGDVRVRGLSKASAQGDVGVLEILHAFGVSTSWDDDEMRAWGAPQQGAVIDLTRMPDLAPPLAAVAARAAFELGATSELRGLTTLRGKESDRVDALARSLEALGFAVEEPLDGLRIGPGTAVQRAAEQASRTFDPRGDHRIAFALALVGTFLGEVRIQNAACVAKSWPRFWQSLIGLGAAVS